MRSRRGIYHPHFGGLFNSPRRIARDLIVEDENVVAVITQNVVGTQRHRIRIRRKAIHARRRAVLIRRDAAFGRYREGGRVRNQARICRRRHFNNYRLGAHFVVDAHRHRQCRRCCVGVQVVRRYHRRHFARLGVVAAQNQNAVVDKLKAAVVLRDDGVLRSQTAADCYRPDGDVAGGYLRNEIRRAVKADSQCRRVNKAHGHNHRRRLRIAVNFVVVCKKRNNDIRRANGEEVVVADSVAGITQRGGEPFVGIREVRGRGVSVCSVTAAGAHSARQGDIGVGKFRMRVLRRHFQRRSRNVGDNQRRHKINGDCLRVVCRRFVSGVKGVDGHRHIPRRRRADNNFIIDNNRRAGTVARNRRRHIAAACAARIGQSRNRNRHARPVRANILINIKHDIRRQNIADGDPRRPAPALRLRSVARLQNVVDDDIARVCPRHNSGVEIYHAVVRAVLRVGENVVRQRRRRLRVVKIILIRRLTARCLQCQRRNIAAAAAAARKRGIRGEGVGARSQRHIHTRADGEIRICAVVGFNNIRS